MRLVHSIVAGAVFAMLSGAAFAAGQPLAEFSAWDQSKDGSPKIYNIGNVKLTFTAVKDKSRENAVFPVLTLNAVGIPPISIKGEQGYDNAAANFSVGRYDPKAPAPQIIFTSYTGGAHCCTRVLLIEPVNGEWKTIDLDTWDGEGLGGVPRDEDGDGTGDFVFYDNSFLYTFASYADSYAPPLIMNVIAGKPANVSTSPRYAALYRQNMANARPDCLKHSNGACAAYVADAARVGEFDAAWKFMLANYDPKSDWDLPTRCKGPMYGFDCKGTPIKPKDYPESLRWFLEDRGYIKKS